jgi:hypothetical protein
MQKYLIGIILIAQRDYLDLIKKDEEYEIISTEDFGEGVVQAVNLSHKGKKISGWCFKEFELDIHFKLK